MARVLSRLDILLHANTANYQREMTRATNETRRQLRSIVDYGQEVSSQLKKAFVQIGGLGAMTGLGMGIISAQREFDVLNAQLITATGSVENASRAMQQLQEFAKTTPYGLNQAVEGFAKLKNLGLGASIESLNSFGNTAAAMGKDLMQLIEAVADASTFEFERLREFGIKSEQQKDKIAFTFQGITTEVTKNAQAIEQYLLKIGNVQFGSAMETRAKTLDGAISALGDSWQGFLRSLGNADIGTISYLGVVKESVVGLSNALDWASENMNVVMLGLATTTLHLGRTMISTGAGITTGWVRAMTGATTASIANAFSVQGQIKAYQSLELKVLSFSTNMIAKIIKVNQAMTATANYTRSLWGLATSLDRATLATKASTLATVGWTNAKRGAMGVGILATRAVTGLGGAFVSLGRIITAHPIIALTAVIGAVIARTEGLSGAVKSLGDAFSVAGILASDFIGGVVDGLGRAWTATANYLNSFMGGTNKAVSFSQTAFGGFFAGTQKGFVGVLQITARVFDLAGASVVTFTKYAWKNISSLGTAIANVFKGIGNFIVFVFEGVINNVVGKINFAIDGMNAISGMFGGGQIARLGQVSIGRMSYGSTDFGFGGFNASIAQNNAHYLETKVVNAYEQVQQSASRANTANLGLAGSMANVASASEKAGAGAKKVADANKLAKKTADEASKAYNDMMESYNNQLEEWTRGLWELKSPIATESHRIKFELEFGKFKELQGDLKENLLSEARIFDQLKIHTDISKLINEHNKTNALLDYNNNEIAELVMSFNDKYNELSLASEDFKQKLLYSVTDLELNKITFDLTAQNKEIRNQIEILSQKSDIDRSILEISQWQNKELAVYNKLLSEGVLSQADYNALKERFDTTANLKKQLSIQTSYNSLVEGLKTDEQKRLDTLKEQLTILAEQHRLSGADAMVERSRLLNNALGLPEQELDPFVKLEQENAHRLAVLDSFMATQQQLYQDNQNELALIEQEGAIARLAIDKHYQDAKNELMITQSESLFGSMAQTAKTAFGEQSRAYRAIFALEKAMAIARSVMAIQTAMAQASANPFPMNLGAMATVASQVANIVGNIRAVAMPVGQAHDGIMSVPKSGTWNLEKGERVLPKHTAQNLDNTLNRLQAGGGQVVINQHITINTDGSHDVKGDSQNQMGQALKAGMLAVIQGEMRQGRSIYNFVKNGR